MVVSIPEVTSQGVDLDFDFTPVENLVFNAGVTYAKTEYGDFTPPFASLFRLPNAQMSFAPEWSGSLAATYERNLGESLLWRANVGAKYTSEYNTGSDLNPAKLQDALTLVNARLALGSPGRALDARGLGAEPDRRGVLPGGVRRDAADGHVRCESRRAAFVRSHLAVHVLGA